MRDRSEWGVLKDDEVKTLNESKICNTYKPGQVIFYQGNPCLGVYCIERGTVAIRKTDASGNSVLVRLAHEGQTLGYRTYFAGGGYTASSEALTEARICFVDRAAVRRLLDHNPSLGLQFLKRIADDLRSSEEQRLAAASLSVRTRMAHLLLVLKDRCATVDDDGTLIIELPLARQDIAAMLGTRPETIARTTKALEQDGIAEFRGRHVLVPDLDALLDEVELDAR
jgi:CRP-like cAMP-binding protein